MRASKTALSPSARENRSNVRLRLDRAMAAVNEAWIQGQSHAEHHTPARRLDLDRQALGSSNYGVTTEFSPADSAAPDDGIEPSSFWGRSLLRLGAMTTLAVTAFGPRVKRVPGRSDWAALGPEDQLPNGPETSEPHPESNAGST